MSVRENLEHVFDRLEAAKRRAGRESDTVRLMAVTKTQSYAAVQEAYQAGVRLFGENRVQEAQEKYATTPAGSELHLIGHLQRNKARMVPGLFVAVQSIDGSRTARALEEAVSRSEGPGGSAGSAYGKGDPGGPVSAPLDIFLEVNTSGEESKFGYRNNDDLLRDTEEIARMRHLRIVGLMTIAPFTAEEPRLRMSFRTLRRSFEKLRSEFPELPLTELSMGMSNDFEIAVEEGSTLVRLGTILFGSRPGGPV
ncbi:MAG: YggS family pyridoxal phosphate-dependent enzyme [Spirochaetaceae bacterium]